MMARNSFCHRSVGRSVINYIPRASTFHGGWSTAEEMPPVCGGGWMDVEPILSPRSLSLTLTLSSGPPGLVFPSNKFCVQYIFYAIERHPAMGEPFGGLFLDAATPASQQEQCLRSNTTITCRFGRNSRIAEWVVGIRPDQ